MFPIDFELFNAEAADGLYLLILSLVDWVRALDGSDGFNALLLFLWCLIVWDGGRRVSDFLSGGR